MRDESCVDLSLANSRRFFTFLWNFVLPCLLGVQGGWKMAPIYLEAFNLWVRRYVAAGALFFLQKNGPHISVSPELVGTLPQAPFFSQKNGPHISGSPKLVGTLPQAPFFLQKNGLHIFGSPKLVGTLPQAPFFSEKWPPYFWKP